MSVQAIEGLVIGGERVDAAEGRTFEVVNPASATPIRPPCIAAPTANAANRRNVLLILLLQIDGIHPHAPALCGGSLASAAPPRCR